MRIVQTDASERHDGVVPCWDGNHVWHVDFEEDAPKEGGSCRCGSASWRSAQTQDESVIDPPDTSIDRDPFKNVRRFQGFPIIGAAGENEKRGAP